MAQYDEQVDGFSDDHDKVEYAEVIVDDGRTQLEMYVQGGGASPSSGASVMLTPRGARELAQRLLAAADIAEDNEE